MHPWFSASLDIHHGGLLRADGRPGSSNYVTIWCRHHLVTSVEHAKSNIYRHGHSHQVYCWSLVWSLLAFGMPLRPWHWQRRAKISSMRLEWRGCLFWRCFGVSPQLRQRLWIDSSQKKDRIHQAWDCNSKQLTEWWNSDDNAWATYAIYSIL